MLELNPSEFHRVAALFEDLPYGPSIPNSVLSGIGHGRVFANSGVQPTAAFVYNNGACTLAGSALDLAFAAQVSQWLLDYEGEDYFIFYDHPEAWEAVLDEKLGATVRKRRRYDYDFKPSKFALLDGWERAIPPGFELRRIDEALMQQVRDKANPYSKSYWRSAADFERNGLGFCILQQDAIVSMCYTAFAWQGHHDIDILTLDAHQRKGLGTLVACAFIDHCVKHDLHPNWDCWTKNHASVALAQKLGFEARVEVPVYHWFRP
jgi:GNAT superfamily N-acetyltransferase